MSTFSIREDLDDLYNWTRIETYFDTTGAIEARYTEFDNGTTKAETFANGVRQFVELTDLSPTGQASDVKSWERIEFYYDETGALDARYDLNDDGTTRFRDYDNGVLRYSEQVDLSPYGDGSDAKPWERIEVFYDETGTIEARYQLNDDGVSIFNEYDNGMIRRKEQVDLTEYGGASDAKSRERIETFYDESGQKELQYQLDDDGVTTLREYDAGVIRRVEQTDLTEYGAPSDARAWERIETFYDENGVIQSRFEQRDDGTTAEREYQDGVLRGIIREDRDMMGNPTDTKAWDFIFTAYDETGTRWAKETLFDDGDVTSILYDPSMFFEGSDLGRIRIEIDGDDSESWAARETLYDANNDVFDINTYDSLNDLPPEYGLLDPSF